MSKMNWIVLAALLVNAVALLESRGVLPSTPQAQALENPSESRLEMLGELQKINARLDRLIGLLEGGKVKVVVGNAEEIRGDSRPAAKAEPKPDVKGQANDSDSRIIIRPKGD